MREQYDRAQLLDEVWAEPVSVVAPRYGLSDVGLKKLCARLQVPTPTRGHWAKVKAGRSIPPKPKLKDFKGDPRQLLKPLTPPSARAPEPELVDERFQAVMAREKEPAHRITVPARVTRWHPQVAATRDAFQQPYKDSRGLPLPHGNGLDIAVSAAQRPRALRIANALVRALEARGFPLVAGARHLEVELFGVRLALSIVEPTTRADYVPTAAELAEKARRGWSYWPRYSYTPSGRLEVRADGGYGGLIRDGVRQQVEEQLNKLVIRMAKRAVGILRYREERARAEALREVQRREALAQKALQEAEQQKLKTLRAAAQRWQEAQLIRAYLDALEQVGLAHGEGRSDAQQAYLRWARAKADWLDPLVDSPDPVLDQVIHVPY
ncbi:hypothetical protein [Pseudomonas aeruginosa]|uniref:hypothetical protein n=1 Tax=Pseudomonas aeruginosa TaxID=287 RepID=UPI0021E7BD4F|nr:hypothetical protein [Pseudomonas aeruginosa]MCV3818922.1 hypothetical protein [Pseudomonas aeruginosa]MCV3831489.1 hypothetical protein [Pseudomonas aeruginosa]MCV3899840.1 hypothetical protein [Pseudomonas aeruginosa]MCV3912575.1 hypothetical protein [Pseudomonas aeruginosa]MCV3924046.1 hypothetical protein [Pseudomonas aeruginosa]